MVEALDLWNETSDRREKVMIERIQSYCRDNTMEKGAFLVGAAHLKGIFEISRQVTARASGYIRWNFADDSWRSLVCIILQMRQNNAYEQAARTLS
jgi:hypothetical protein